MSSGRGRPSNKKVASREASLDLKQPKLVFTHHTTLTLNITATTANVVTGALGNAGGVSSAHVGAAAAVRDALVAAAKKADERDGADRYGEEEDEDVKERDVDEERDEEVGEEVGEEAGEEADDDDGSQPARAGAGGPPPAKRRRYSDAEKSAVLSILAEEGGNLSAAERRLKSMPGYRDINRATITR
jgi:hypothetical protein